MLLIDKYKPKSMKEIVGNDTAIRKLKESILNNQISLVYGHVGSGKTSAVYAIAQDLNYEILEINASEFRDEESINKKICGANEQQSLFKSGKIILVEEADYSNKEDRGYLKALSKSISKNRFPIVLIAENPFSSQLYNLRKKSTLIEFKKLNYSTIFNKLKEICVREGIKFDENILKSLAIRSSGDLRAAINDLQSLTIEKKEVDYDLSMIGERKQKESIFNAIRLILKSKDCESVIKAFDNVDLELDECFLWLDENIAREYKGLDLVKAYDTLSKSDIFRGRIRRMQYWRFIVYMNYLMTCGIALSKKDKDDRFVAYNRTGRILKLWISKNKNAKKLEIAKKLARKTHCSIKKSLQNTLPYLQTAIKKNKDLVKELELNKEEVEWINL